MTNPLQHLADLLADHDGDDRCGCLNESVWQLAVAEDPDTELDNTIRRISSCLADHPAGMSLRGRTPTSPALLEGARRSDDERDLP